MTTKWKYVQGGPVMAKMKFHVVCAIHEVVSESPHRYFVWAKDGVEAVMMPCPACGSEGITAQLCEPYYSQQRRRATE